MNLSQVCSPGSRGAAAAGCTLNLTPYWRMCWHFSDKCRDWSWPWVWITPTCCLNGGEVSHVYHSGQCPGEQGHFSQGILRMLAFSCQVFLSRNAPQILFILWFYIQIPYYPPKGIIFCSARLCGSGHLSYDTFWNIFRLVALSHVGFHQDEEAGKARSQAQRRLCLWATRSCNHGRNCESIRRYHMKATCISCCFPFHRILSSRSFVSLPEHSRCSTEFGPQGFLLRRELISFIVAIM